jgi:hypothetical protein
MIRFVLCGVKKYMGKSYATLQISKNGKLFPELANKLWHSNYAFLLPEDMVREIKRRNKDETKEPGSLFVSQDLPEKIG